jgi:hypothetical protein
VIGRSSNYSKSFQGNFDGNNKKITLAINHSNNNNAAGLFGCVSNKCVLKSIVVDGYVNAKLGAAGIVCGIYMPSTNSDTIIINKCINLANITSEYAAGIVSYGETDINMFINNGGLFIDSCVNYGNITASFQSAGIFGSVDCNFKAMRIKNCQNGGFITSTRNDNGYAGGIAIWYGGKIIDCLNHGTVTSAGNNASGIVCELIDYDIDDFLGNEVRNCINAGYIKGKTIAGGIVGKSTNHSSRRPTYISNCLNVNSVKSDVISYRGGIIGIIDGTSTTIISNCHYDKQLCSVGVSGANVILGVEAHLTINMVGTKLQSKLGTADWHYDTNLYPQLKCLLYRWW